MVGVSKSLTRAVDDVPLTHPYNPYIDIIKQRSVTLGCSINPPLYCTNQNVTREQMAAFIMRALGEFNPPTPQIQRFADVPPSNGFYNFIDRMAVLGITLGCGGGNYCPASFVTRGEMVTFLERAVGRTGPPTPAQQRFTDVDPSNTFYKFIESFVQHGESRGIMDVINSGATLGLLCGTGNGATFCPSQYVTRAEMAPFSS
jgi:S-layer family protein